MKKILVPCDFSPPSIEAFKFAVDIAAKSEGRVILLNVVELPKMHDTMMPVMDYEMSFFNELKKTAEKRFDKIRKHAVDKAIKTTTLVELGSIQHSIIRIAEEKNVDLIVMGTHGASGVRELFIGSHADKIVRNAPVPVIAIHKPTKAKLIKHIVFPTHLLLTEGKLIKQVKKLQEFFSAKLHLLVVNTPGNMKRTTDEEHGISEYAAHYHLENFTINTRNDFTVESGIAEFANEIKADMIAMGTHGRKGLAHFFLRSIAEDVVNHTDCAVWTFVSK
ncbi:MAG: universal stress protein [Bacteroidetes bacterium]|nr:universal stress protein [Bacteroidota bacterium]